MQRGHIVGEREREEKLWYTRRPRKNAANRLFARECVERDVSAGGFVYVMVADAMTSC